MKNFALPLSVSICLFFAACSDNQPPKDSGQEQVPGPVQNSGPETEAARANKAVQDTSEKTDKKDTVATSNDHNH
ncbi:MAG: hypothetical protein H0X41_03225 [Chitinophagaceae bacterium]|nr:hypothetical protein [Chitinophagaceae bacterium]